MKTEFIIRELEETNQILITAKNKKLCKWMLKQLKDVRKR